MKRKGFPSNTILIGVTWLVTITLGVVAQDNSNEKDYVEGSITADPIEGCDNTVGISLGDCNQRCSWKYAQGFFQIGQYHFLHTLLVDGFHKKTTS